MTTTAGHDATPPPAPSPSSPPSGADTHHRSPILVANDLRRVYGTGKQAFAAVEGLDLEIQEGELLALLGTNGAGKTSTLEVLEGLAPASAGSVRVFDADPFRDRKQVRPRQGLMLQTGGFPSDLSASEALAMWCSTLSDPRPVAELLDRVDLADRSRTRISSLSGGEVRRLDLACAISGDPDLLFLDEPTTGLDPESRARAWELIAGLKARGTTIVLTTHYLDEAESLADRLAIMHHGRIVTEGTVAGVVAGYPATIRFLPPQGLPDGPDPALLRGDLGTDRGRLLVTTHHLQQDLTALLGWATHHHLTLEGLDARAASLESVFLSIAHEGDIR
jgi:ABC-2 type transport system ATP-binding protein